MTTFPDAASPSVLDHAISDSEEVLARATGIADEHDEDIPTHSTGGRVAKTIVSYAEERDTITSSWGVRVESAFDDCCSEVSPKP